MSTATIGAPYGTIIDLAPSSAILPATTIFVSGAHGADAIAGPLLHDLTLSVNFAVLPAPGSIDVYQLRAVDGTNFPYGGAGLVPQTDLRVAQMVPARVIGSTLYLHKYDLPAAPGAYVYLVVNNTGADMPAGWTFKVRPHSVQSG